MHIDVYMHMQTDRQTIADVFANFYAELYTSKTVGLDAPYAEMDETISPFSRCELDKALEELKAGRSPDSSGVLSEMLKAGGDYFWNILLDLYNCILRPTSPAPSSWRKTTMTVIYKSGDACLPQNYRPIAVIPILYKLFARLLYNRLAPVLDLEQSVDQAGFRRSYSTLDHLSAFTTICEKAGEWQKHVWIATLDYKKAFDTVEHEGLWEALRNQNVSDGYVQVLRRLYSKQRAQVKTDVVSKQFDIARGTKQGDPLSSLLFNALLEDIFRKVQPRWVHEKFGLKLGHADQSMVTTLRCADDVLLMSTSLTHLTAMLADIDTES